MIYIIASKTVPLADNVTYYQFCLKADSNRQNFTVPPVLLDHIGSEDGTVSVVMDALSLSNFKEGISRSSNSKWFSNHHYKSLVFYGASKSSLTRIVTYPSSKHAVHTRNFCKDVPHIPSSPIDFFHSVLDNKELVSDPKLVIVLPEWSFHETFIPVYGAYISNLLQTRREGSLTVLVSTTQTESVTKRLCLFICHSSNGFVVSIDVPSRAALCNFFFSETDAETFDDWHIGFESGSFGEKNMDLLLMSDENILLSSVKKYFSNSGKIECSGKFTPVKSLKAGETVNIEFLLLHEATKTMEEHLLLPNASVEDVLALSPCSETIASLKKLPELLEIMDAIRQLEKTKTLPLPLLPLMEKGVPSVVGKKIDFFHRQIIQKLMTSYDMNDNGLSRGVCFNEQSIARGASYIPLGEEDFSEE